MSEQPKKKRKRTIIPPEQVEKLEALFFREQWPSRIRKEDLAQELGQTEHFVSVWFQNRRARQKKEDLIAKPKVDEQMIPILSDPALLNDLNSAEKDEPGLYIVQIYCTTYRIA